MRATPWTLAMTLLLAGRLLSGAEAPEPEGSNPALREELLRMVDRDQEVRNRWVKDQKNPALLKEMEEIDAANRRRLHEIVAAHGWPGKTLVGVRGGGAAWTIAQHDVDKVWQRKALGMMKEAAAKDELEWGLVATSEDRVLLGEGKKQLYGTQFGDDGEPEPIEDPAHVDERRAKVGLGPLAEYRALLREAYGYDKPKAAPAKK